MEALRETSLMTPQTFLGVLPSLHGNVNHSSNTAGLAGLRGETAEDKKHDACYRVEVKERQVASSLPLVVRNPRTVDTLRQEDAGHITVCSCTVGSPLLKQPET